VLEGKAVKNRLHLDVRVGTGLVGEERVGHARRRCARLADLGAGERDRTADLPFTRRPLCQLSYTGGDLLMVADPQCRMRARRYRARFNT
jgi:hypothetical protein